MDWLHCASGSLSLERTQLRDDIVGILRVDQGARRLQAVTVLRSGKSWVGRVWTCLDISIAWAACFVLQKKHSIIITTEQSKTLLGLEDLQTVSKQSLSSISISIIIQEHIDCFTMVNMTSKVTDSRAAHLPTCTYPSATHDSYQGCSAQEYMNEVLTYWDQGSPAPSTSEQWDADMDLAPISEDPTVCLNRQLQDYQRQLSMLELQNNKLVFAVEEREHHIHKHQSRKERRSITSASSSRRTSASGNSEHVKESSRVSDWIKQQARTKLGGVSPSMKYTLPSPRRRAVMVENKLDDGYISDVLSDFQSQMSGMSQYREESRMRLHGEVC